MKNVKHILRIAIVSVSLITVTSCKNETSNSQNASINTSEKTTLEQEAKPEFKTPAVASTFQHYIQLKSTLVASDFEKAKKDAKMLSEVAEDVNVKEIASKIGAAEDIKTQRELFSDLTTALKPVLVADISSGELYEQHCPMALNGGANWFATEKQVNNPYYGDAMLHCGIVQETIK